MAFSLEDLIRWEQLSNSLQQRFVNIERSAKKNVVYIDRMTNDYHVTIGYEPPLNPEGNVDIWFDTGRDVLKFYIDRNNDKNFAWETTKAAWYGGSSSSVSNPSIYYTGNDWDLMRSIVWISNAAHDGQYNSAGEPHRDNRFTAPISGTYKIEDRTHVFQYNTQANYYTHDGGSVVVTITKSTKNKDGTYTDSIIYTATYDSRANYSSIKEGTTPPSITVTLKAGDRINTDIRTINPPVSSDNIAVMQTCTINIYIDPKSKKYDDPYGIKMGLNTATNFNTDSPIVGWKNSSEIEILDPKTNTGIAGQAGDHVPANTNPNDKSVEDITGVKGSTNTTTSPGTTNNTTSPGTNNNTTIPGSNVCHTNSCRHHPYWFNLFNDDKKPSTPSGPTCHRHW